MDFKIFTPLHGWRAFVGEVGVIVLGVLLALGAQQLASDIQIRKDVRAFRQTLDHEVALNLFVYEVRSRQFQCTAKRIAELRAWLDQARSGAAVPSINPTPPGGITPYRSAWESRDADVFDHLPPRVRQKYAEFYDELSNNWSIMQAEQANWIRLAPYAEPGPLTLTDRRTIRPIIAVISNENKVLEGDLAVSRDIAKVLDVRPVAPDDIPRDLLKRVSVCRSVIAPSS